MVTAELAALDESWKRGEWQPRGRGWHSDPTAARAVHQMEATDRLRAERAELEEIAAEARRLAEGIRRLLGDGYADALTLRYLEGQQWQEVARRLGVCESTARNRVSVSLDTIDSLGRASVMSGRGTATD